MLDILLHVEIAVAEGGRGLRLPVKRRQFLFASNDSHPTATPTRGCLDNDWVTHLASPFLGLVLGSNHTIRTRQNRYPMLFNCCAGLFLLTHQSDHFRRWPDKFQSAGLAHFRKVRVFGE